MRFRYGPVLALVALAGVCAAAPDAPAPRETGPSGALADSVIILPTPPVTVVPPPVPVSRVVLTGQAIYDFRTTAPCVVRAYPAALVTIASEAVGAGETLRVRDTFFDGGTLRTYNGPATVYFVKAAGKGAVELVITPLGLKLESDIKTVGLDVDAGEGPIPPPKPKPDPPVPPDPPKPSPVTSFRVFLVFESGDTLTAAQRGVVYGIVVEKWLNENCTGGKAGWRRRDKDAPGEADPTMLAFWDAIKPGKLPNGMADPNRITVTPCVAVAVSRQGQADIKTELINIEATPAKMVEVLMRYKDGK